MPGSLPPSTMFWPVTNPAWSEYKMSYGVIANLSALRLRFTLGGLRRLNALSFKEPFPNWLLLSDDFVSSKRVWISSGLISAFLKKPFQGFMRPAYAVPPMASKEPPIAAFRDYPD